jgi:hypothetical protein
MGGFDTSTALPLGKQTPVPMNTRVSEPQGYSGPFEEEINFLTLLGIEINFLKRPFH